MSWTKSRLVECIGNRRIKFLARIFELLPKDSKRPNFSLGWERVFKLGSRVCVIPRVRLLWARWCAVLVQGLNADESTAILAI